jgi:hypothetical protein
LQISAGVPPDAPQAAPRQGPGRQIIGIYERVITAISAQPLLRLDGSLAWLA